MAVVIGLEPVLLQICDKSYSVSSKYWTTLITNILLVLLSFTVMPFILMHKLMYNSICFLHKKLNSPEHRDQENQTHGAVLTSPKEDL